MTDQTKLRKRLEALLKLPENQVCADCGKRGPRWASANLGVFMCIECSGIHRNLGVHISFVRSVNLDSWTVLQVQFMEEWGNGRANKYYEANVPREYLRPKENDSVRNIERFIRDKYEHKRFIASSPPPKSNTAEEQPIEQPKSRSTVKTSANPAPSVSKPKQVVAPAPAAPEPNLLDFMDAPPPPAPVTNHSFPPAQQPQQQQSFQQQAPVQSFVPTQQTPPGFTQGGFGDFGPPVAFPGGSQSFGGSGGAPAGYLGSPQTNGAAAIDPFLVPHPQAQPLPPAAPIEQQQQPPAAPKQSADAILSLYSVPPTNYGGPQGGMGGHGMGISMMGGGGGYPGGGPMQMMPMPNQGGGYPRHSMPMGAGGMMMPNPGGYLPAASGYPQQQQHQQQQQQPIPGYGFPNTGGVPPQQQQPGFPTQQQQQQQQQQPNMGMGMMGHSPANNYMNQQSLPRGGGGGALPYGQQLPVQQQQQQHPSYMPQQQQPLQQQQHPGAMGMGLPYSNVQPQAAPYGMMPPNAMQQPPGGGGFPNYGGAR